MDNEDGQDSEEFDIEYDEENCESLDDNDKQNTIDQNLNEGFL